MLSTLLEASQYNCVDQGYRWLDNFNVSRPVVVTYNYRLGVYFYLFDYGHIFYINSGIGLVNYKYVATDNLLSLESWLAALDVCRKYGFVLTLPVSECQALKNSASIQGKLLELLAAHISCLEKCNLFVEEELEDGTLSCRIIRDYHVNLK